MMLEEHTTKELIARLVGRMTADAAMRDDLMQEALIHFWLVERSRPGQTPSYYLQSCRFHLQHCLAAGRSVDSTKRRSGQVPLHHDHDEEEQCYQRIEADTAFLGSVCAREIVSLIAPRLKPREQAVLECLAEGLGPRDIARRLNVSHPAAIKCRRKIAALATKLGIAAPLPSRSKAE